MNFTRYAITVALVLAMGLGAAGQTDSKPAVDPASWVPSDALAYVGISDIKELSDQFRKTAFYRLMQDPDAKESWRQVSILLRFYEAFKNRLAKSLDIEPPELRNPFGGPAAMYLATARGEPADELQPVFVAGIGDASLVRDYYDRATRKFSEMADSHEKISFGSYTIDQFRTEAPAEEDEGPNDEDSDEFHFDAFDADDESFAMALDELFGGLFSADAMPEELVLCLTEDRLIVAPTPEHVKEVLGRERSGGSLVETEAYRALVREFQPLGSIRWLIDLRRLFEMMEAAEGREAREALTMLGAKSMQSVIGHVLYDNQQFESKLEAMLLLNGERSGLAKILSMKNRPVTSPASVPADSFIYASVNANPIEILDELEAMIRRDDPDAADEMRASTESLELPGGEKVSLRKELLEKLCEPLTFAMAFQRPYGPQSTWLQLTLGHRDKEAVACFLENVSSLTGETLLKREAHGRLAYDLAYGGFSLAPTDKAIIAGTTNAVDAGLQAPDPGQSLAADPGFQRATALAPREAWGVLYVDSRRLFETAFEMAKNKDALTAGQVANPANLIALGIVEAFTMSIDDNQIDAARQLAKYQAPSIITVATTPDGIRLTQIQLRPETD
jgi:hypothetical protein